MLIAALSKNQTLQSIDFSYNNLSGGTHSPHLYNFLSANKALNSLNLQECMLGDEHIASLVRGFGPNSKITKLMIGGNYMGTSGLGYLAESF